jgi:MSHA biogenesis protein MshP
MSRNVLRQSGFLLMAAVFLVVVVGAFIGYLATQSNVQQSTITSDIQSARALQAARAGMEWGAYQLMQGGATCAAFPSTITFPGTTLSPFTTSVTCSSVSSTEGASTIVTYQIVSTACNVPACPNTTTTASTYVERQVSLTIAK